MINEKLDFLQKDYPKILSTLVPNQKGVFGKMNAHQMVEHMTWAFQIANGKIKFPSANSPDITEKMYRFMMSDKPFRDNTPNINLPDEPLPTQTDTMTEAIRKLESELSDMVKLYQADNDLRIENPFFGALNFEEQIQLLHKHAQHHLRQFEAMPL